MLRQQPVVSGIRTAANVKRTVMRLLVLERRKYRPTRTRSNQTDAVRAKQSLDVAGAEANSRQIARQSQFLGVQFAAIMLF